MCQTVNVSNAYPKLVVRMQHQGADATQLALMAMVA